MLDELSHVGIIPDGNRRWAEKNGLPALAGHKRGIEKLKELLEWGRDAKLDTLSVWILSTENLLRSKQEVQGLFNYFEQEVTTHLKDKLVDEYHVYVRFIGNIEILPKKLQKLMKDVEKKSEKYKNEKKLNLFTAYGGRDELLNAVNSLLDKGIKHVDEKSFEKYLYITECPDLIIRTSGEMRISGFMPWQSIYSELYFSEKLWPDFTRSDFFDAIEDYKKRKRRFGR